MDDTDKTKPELLTKPDSIRKDRDLQSQILSNLVDLVVVFDENRRITFANEIYCRTFGKSPEDLPGYEFISQVHEEDQDKVLASLKTLKKSPHTCMYRERAITKDGWRWFEWRNSAQLDKRGKIRNIVALGRDITGQVEMEEELKEKEARFQLALDAGGAGTWELDLKTGKVHIDERLGEIFNMKPDNYEATREFWRDLIHPDDMPLTIKVTDKAIRDNQPYHFQCRIAGGDGNWRHIEVEGKVVRDDSGDPLKIVGMTIDVTEQKQMENELFEWGILFKNAELGIAVGSPGNENIEMVNPSLARMYGYSVEELTGLPIARLFAADTVENLPEHIRITHEKGRHSFESIHVRKDGTRFPVLVDATAIRDENDRVVKRIVHIKDITGQKAMERELDLQHRLKELFMESMPCFAFLAKYDRTILAINQLGAEMGGQVGMTCVSSITPFDDHCPWCKLPQLIETGERQYWEGFAEGIHWEAHWVPIEDDLYLHYAFDVSEKVHAKKQIEESEEKFRTTFMTIPDGIGLTRLSDNTFVDVNEGFTAISGYPAEEVRGKPVQEVGIWYDESNRDQMIELIQERGVIHNFEARGRKKDGSQFDALISARMITLHGQPHLIVIFKDISEKKETEKALQRSAHLATVGQIASGVAHELNNPLATIAACAEVLGTRAGEISSEPELRDKMVEYISLIEEEVERSSMIIQELLDFARIRPLHISGFQLWDLIESTVKLFSIQSAYRDYSFNLSPCEDIPEILADRDRMRQVLIILLTNACEAMSSGGVVSVSCTGDSENRHVVFSVTDEGTGISPEEAERIFEPFYTTKLEEKGTGLGLSTADSIVTKHGGNISVQSALGEGSTFKVTLPVITAFGEG